MCIRDRAITYPSVRNSGAGSVGVVQSARAIFGVGDIVLDPSNLIQNIMTAARALEQINNQIRSLQNEAQMLMNEAKNLTSLDFSALNELRDVYKRQVRRPRRSSARPPRT